MKLEDHCCSSRPAWVAVRELGRSVNVCGED